LSELNKFALGDWSAEYADHHHHTDKCTYGVQIHMRSVMPDLQLGTLFLTS